MGDHVAWIDFDTMERFMVDVFIGCGVPEGDARICADVLITADKRGIDSHGIGRLKTIYYDRIKEGTDRSNLKLCGRSITVVDVHNAKATLLAKIYGPGH